MVESLPPWIDPGFIRGVQRPRILLVPNVTALEWPIRADLEEWADVATFDAPGVGDSPPVHPLGPAAVVERGLEELERRGWERAIIVGDEAGAYNAIELARRRPATVRALALGHAALSNRTREPRPAIRAEVLHALRQLQRVDYRAYARALTQVTREAYDQSLCEEYIERVPRAVDEVLFDALSADERNWEDTLRSLRVPMLLVEHADCALWTHEGYADAVAALPQARTASLALKPSANPEFAELLREFTAQLPP